MRIKRSLIQPLVVLGLGLMAVDAHAAASLSELFNTVPTPPTDVVEAATWVQNGTVVAPAYTGFIARLKVEKDAIAAVQAQAAAKASVPADQDSPGVLTAVNAFKVYTASNSGDMDPAKVLGKRQAWLYGRFTKIVVTVPALKQQQSAAELDAYQSLFKDWQKSHAGVVSLAEGQLAGAGDPAAIRSGANLQSVEQYRAAMIGQVETLLSVTTQAVKRAAETQAGVKASVSASAAP